jgi:hypothetical protein
MKDRTFERMPSPEKLLYVITQQCKDCVGVSRETGRMGDGTREDIALCTDLKCPLFNYRPFVE